ncbi:MULTISPECIES: hypothetical protein [Zoogloea]|jgi:hypothetical protein|uniref:Uncharacterized protein n=1 Tax=Zoogloea oleivorans TaxID=1552750 RepID=A0A6C2CLM0_9RHOO|nr:MULTISPECIES: hypothetical protein [Zoogloea]MBT9499559.1 hypothetical protein [Zoogloea sp.]MDD2668053.1 hypothetical protein [Zoogloea sp.]MDY0037751.1 hypothetical protein [Zoogloea oleivorans]TYC54871.1 hypothetical protein ETQ85_17050 [Zoogloea oleivorans]
MRRETAYKLAGRKHESTLHHAGSGIAKVREIRFKDFPPGQAAQARRSLAALRGVQVEPGRDDSSLLVRYNVLDYTLELLESCLIDAGFHLDRTLLIRLHRALIYYVEDTQVHNLRSPERLIKQSHEVYIKAYAAHPHGDHDDTPPDLREYK